MRNWILSLAASLALAAPAIASAQPAPGDQALAAALFDDARRLLDEGRIDAACDKLAQSQKLEPLLGTLLNLAVCHEKQGRTASAWIELSAAAEQAAARKDAARARFALERARALEKKLSRLTIKAEAPPAGLVVKLDGKDLGAAALGTPMPLDPGRHAVEVSAPGRTPWSREVAIEPGATDTTIEVPSLVEEAPPPPPAVTLPPPPPAAPPGATLAAPPPAAPSAKRDARRFVAGLAVGGVGLAGVGVGAVYGIRTFVKKGEIGGACSPAGVCNSDGFAVQGDAHQAAAISTVAFVVGLTAVATGTILVVTANRSRSPPASAWVAPAMGGLQAGARW